MLRHITKRIIPCQTFARRTERFQALHNPLQFRASSIAATFAKEASPASTPTIADILIEMTFVDPKGARRKVKGMAGKSCEKRVSTPIFDMLLMFF
jgi:hypothetical protein